MSFYTPSALMRVAVPAHLHRHDLVSLMQQFSGGVVKLGLMEHVGLVQQFGGAMVGLHLVHVLCLMEEFSGGVVRLNLMQQLRGRLQSLDFVHLVKDLIW